MAFELIGEGSQTVTGVALQAGAQYLANLPTIGKGVKATYVPCNLSWTGVTGSDSGSTATVYCWGVWNYADSIQTAILRVAMGLWTGAANASTYAVAIAANAAGSQMFLPHTGGTASSDRPLPASQIMTPFFGFGLVKGGTGTITAGTFTLSYKLYGFTR